MDFWNTEKYSTYMSEN